MKTNLKTYSYIASAALTSYALAFFIIHQIGVSFFQYHWVFETIAILGVATFFMGLYRHPDQMPPNSLFLRIVNIVVGCAGLVTFFWLNRFFQYCDDGPLTWIHIWWAFRISLSIILTIYFGLIGFLSQQGGNSCQLKKYALVALIFTAVAIPALMVGSIIDTINYVDYTSYNPITDVVNHHARLIISILCIIFPFAHYVAMVKSAPERLLNTATPISKGTLVFSLSVLYYLSYL